MSTHANALTIRDLRPSESDALGRLMVEVYSSLEGFPTFEEQPRYYELLAHIGAFAEKPGVRVLAAVTGAGKALAKACIELAREAGHREVILHTTAPMQVAWTMYERMGFVRAEELDFLQEGYPVLGFRRQLRAGDR